MSYNDTDQRGAINRQMRSRDDQEDRDNMYRRDRGRRRSSRDRATDRNRYRDRDPVPDTQLPDTAKYDDPWDNLPPPVPPLPPSTSNSTLDEGESDADFYSFEDEPSAIPPVSDHNTSNPVASPPGYPIYEPARSNRSDIDSDSPPRHDARIPEPEDQPHPRSNGHVNVPRYGHVPEPRLRVDDMVNDGYEIPVDFPRTDEIPLDFPRTDEIPLDFPHTDDDDMSDGDVEKGKYKMDDRREHTTVDLGPGVYKPVIGKQKAPPHHSKSKDEKLHESKEFSLDNIPDKKGLMVFGEDENEERGNWSGRFDFILSMLGYAVGLGNVWRFPYLCYRNGGGAFLFPFLVMMVVIGLPLFYLEASLGQFTSCGAMTCWHFAPIFKGVGVAMVMVSAMTGIYYNMILGWALHYMFASFTSDLPFASCDNYWNTDDCKLKWPLMSCDQEEETQATDGTCQDAADDVIGLWNRTLFAKVTGRNLTSPSQEYWENRVLRFSSGIDDFGQPKWDLVLCLLLAWTICFFCLIKGIKTTGKVVYFTAIFPYVVLVILFFRGVTLDNAGEGIRFFITPKFGKLLDANVWKDAANQIFFSMSIAGGGLITLSSYNRFHNNILRDSLIVAIGDSFTCVLGGFVIFSYLGYMAGQLDVAVEDVAASGAGLAFVVYPEAVSNLPPPTLWALLFFFMLLTLGLDSQFAMIETVLTGVLDQYPKYRPKKVLVILSICCILFILGLPLTCPGGMYLLQLMDNYVGGMTLIILGFVELVAIVLVYGVNRFCQDIHLMTGSINFIFWKVTWCALSPFTILFIFIFMFVDYKRSTYDDYTYPVWADVLGWLFTVASVLAIPIAMLLLLSKETEGSNLLEKIRLLSLPTIYWGPALKKHRALVNYVDGFQVDPTHGLKPRTAFSNPGFVGDKGGGSTNGKAYSIKSNGGDTLRSQYSFISTATSKVSMISGLSRGTTASDKTGATFETSI